MSTLKVNNDTDRIIGVPVSAVRITQYVVGDDGDVRPLPFRMGPHDILQIELPEEITCRTKEIQIGLGADILNWPDMPNEYEEAPNDQ